MDKIEVKLKCFELAQTRSVDPAETLERAKQIHTWVTEEETHAADEKSHKNSSTTPKGPSGQTGKTASHR